MPPAKAAFLTLDVEFADLRSILPDRTRESCCSVLHPSVLSPVNRFVERTASPQTPRFSWASPLSKEPASPWSSSSICWPAAGRPTGPEGIRSPDPDDIYACLAYAAELVKEEREPSVLA